jgi:hypothetical protein
MKNKSEKIFPIEQLQYSRDFDFLNEFFDQEEAEEESLHQESPDN